MVPSSLKARWSAASMMVVRLWRWAVDETFSRVVQAFSRAVAAACRAATSAWLAVVRSVSQSSMIILVSASKLVFWAALSAAAACSPSRISWTRPRAWSGSTQLPSSQTWPGPPSMPSSPGP